MDFQDELNRLKEMVNLRNLNQDPPVDFYDLKRSDEGDNEINSLTMEPFDTLLMGDEVINTIPERENDEFIKSSIDDLVPIPRESEVTLVCDELECDIPITTPTPPTDVREEDFDINSLLGEQVVNFLMENVDVAGLPRHLVKRLFSHLLKNPSLTKGMSDEPLGDDLKPRSYDGTFSNPLFDFNDDYTLCYDNPLFDEEFKDISSLDSPKSTPINHEPLGNPDSVSKSLETMGDILFLEHMLIEESFFNPTPEVLPKESTLLVTPLPDPKQICLREVERFDPFFSLTQSDGKTRVMETPLFGFHHMPSPRPAAYSPTEVMYCYYHPHLTSGDGFDHGPKMK
ncbi:hypothetical protein Tco_1344371 [Tanacetum coccineum]